MSRGAMISIVGGNTAQATDGAVRITPTLNVVSILGVST